MNIQLQDMGDLDAVNAVYTTFFNSNLPARTSYGVATIPLNALVQIDVVLSNTEGTPPTSAV
ncbi:Rid family hydrolase [Aliidiomarina quisquiliarum]|uniref:Rid family hydrolase n=1 Tax=Aliidiomarina quisquiliarum TaxID=2938947 RepID=UPI00208FD2D3|nr:RidA family protein [Aliidiomarina quisquiliarum]